MTSTIPAHMLAEAPRIWIDRGSGQILRAIDPAWLCKTAKAIAVAEARNAIDEPLASTENGKTTKAPNAPSELERVPAALRIVDRVLSAHGISRDALFGSTKTRTAVAARSEASYRLFAAGHSYSAIGRMLKRDRTTIMHAIETWPERARKLGIELAPLARTSTPVAPEALEEGQHAMKNRLSDLNNHLFAQLERLSDEDLSPEQIETEAKRADAIVSVADQIIKTAAIGLQAAKLASDHGADPVPYLKSIEARASTASVTAIAGGKA